MTRSDRHDGLRERVSVLSDSQRRALAAELAGDDAGSPRAVSPAAGHDDPSVPRRLVAYVVGSGTPPASGELASFLAERLPPYMVPSRYVALDRLPRTPAGKLDRRAVASLVGTELRLSEGGFVAPRCDAEARLGEIWKEVLAIEEVSIHDDFFEIGGDSLLSIRVIARAGRAGMAVSPEAFFANPTIAGLAALVGSTAAAPADQGVVTGSAPLTPIQEWFFERIPAEQHHWNQAFLVTPPTSLQVEVLRKIVGEMLAHHDALRLRFVREGDGWRQDFGGLAAYPDLRVVDLSQTPESERAGRIAAEANDEHTSLDLEAGHLFRVVLFDAAPGFRRVLLLAHHLVVDAVSWGILFEDLSTLTRQALAGSPLRLPPKTVSALEWATELGEGARSPELTDAAAHWTAVPSGAPRPGAAETSEPPATTGDVEGPNANLVGDARTLTLTLDESETTALLEGAARRMSTTAEALLLGAFLLAWKQWTGRAHIQLDVEGHGRDALAYLDASRTVGWFTAVSPLQVTLPEDTPESAVQAVGRALSALPGGRSAHGLLRYLHPDVTLRRSLADQPKSTVLFNYLGSADGLLPADSGFEWAPESTGRARSEVAPRAYLVEVNAVVRGGCATLVFEYSGAVHRREEIEALADATGAALRAMLDPSDVPSSFALSGLDVAGLSRVADLLAAADGE